MNYELIFWFAFAIVFYTYLGYGILLWLMVRIKRILHPIEEGKEGALTLPDVTLLICAYNEEDVIDQKMQNCMELNYPREKLHILWVTDGSTDSTVERLSAYPDIEVMHSPERRGKTAALNRSVPQVQTPLVVFCDANTLLCPDAIMHIVCCFEDPKVGCVSGEKRILVSDGDGMAAKGEGAYWRYESTLKRLDSELCSTMGAAGELFALRTALFRPVASDVLLDDFVLSLQTVIDGYRIAYTSEAYACETGSASMTEEQKRKQRIAAGGLQSIGLLLPLLNPFRYGIITFQLISHRYLRWTVTPFCLLALLPLNVALVVTDGSLIYSLALAAQLLFYAAAAIGMRIPRYFLFMNLNVFRGIRYLLTRKRGNGAWEKAQRIPHRTDPPTP